MQRKRPITDITNVQGYAIMVLAKGKSEAIVSIRHVCAQTRCQKFEHFSAHLDVYRHVSWEQRGVCHSPDLGKLYQSVILETNLHPLNLCIAFFHFYLQNPNQFFFLELTMQLKYTSLDLSLTHTLSPHQLHTTRRTYFYLSENKAYKTNEDYLLSSWFHYTHKSTMQRLGNVMTTDPGPLFSFAWSWFERLKFLALLEHNLDYHFNCPMQMKGTFKNFLQTKLHLFQEHPQVC